MNCYKRLGFAFMCILVVRIATLPLSAATCSNETLKGRYGIFITGYDSSGFYQYSATQINSNGAGSFTGVETISDDGTVYNNLATTGTYSIAADCTGSGTIISVKSGQQRHYNFVVDSAGQQIEVAGTDSGHAIESGYGVALGATTCTLTSVAGTYGFHGGGYLVGQGVLQFDGQFILDGTGIVTGIETRDVNGVVVSAGAVTGTYTVAANCTGHLTYTFSGGTVHLNNYFVNGQKEFFAIETDSGTVSSAVFHQ
jgi:hypothetical protein